MPNEITENTPLNVLVTGATSAVGREVTRLLSRAGHRVVGTTSGYEDAPLVRADGGIPAYPDLLRAGELRSLMVASKTDVVINLAPQLANHLPQQPAKWDARLVDEGVAALLEAAQTAEVKFVVHTSYAFADESVEALRGFLEAVKAGEQKVLQGSVPGCVLRFGFVYGAESPELVAVRNALLNGRPVEMGDNHAHACWIYARDAAQAVMLAAQQRPAGMLLTLVDDHPASPAAFLNHFAQTQGLTNPGRMSVPWGKPSKQQAALMGLSPHVSSAEAKEKLGWSPRFPSFEQGIDDTLLAWRTTAGA